MGGSADASNPRAHDTVELRNTHGAVAFYSLGQGGNLVAVRDSDMGQCPDCEKAVMTYYQTGQIDPVCKTCGAHRVVLQQYMVHGHQ
ncbi:MAG TPA: hypothetical protein VKK61_04940 [Tepidisphaeraceae bacterium]|nr:hypothetical protein [Tepidisphaeraceae bacterium]